MHENISLYDEVVAVFKQNKVDSEFSLNVDLKKLLNSYEKLIKPDFLFLMDMRNPDLRVVFQKNYKLINNEGNKNITLESILAAMDVDVLNTLIEIDTVAAVYTSQHFKKPFEYLLHVGIPVELIKGRKQFLLRTGTVLSFDKSGVPHYVIGYFNDITKVSNGNKAINFYVSSDYCETKEIAELEQEFTHILNSRSKLTKREREVLGQISFGYTSVEISKKLNISKATVDTHRQNMIKKFKVSNVLELLSRV